MRSLESRIEKLEQASPSGPFPVIIVRPVRARGGKTLPLSELRGLDTQGGYVMRRAGESEQALKNRAVAVAERHRVPRCGVVLIEDWTDGGK